MGRFCGAVWEGVDSHTQLVIEIYINKFSIASRDGRMERAREEKRLKPPTKSK